jgi:ferredoxin
MTKILPKSNLDAVIRGLHEAGYRVVGPVRQGRLVTYGEITSAADLALDAIVTRDSIKKFVLPRTEVLARFERDATGKVKIADAAAAPQPTVIIGCRPCDAAALPIDDLVFDWDSHDRFWFSRRESVRLVTISCARCDESCFCTSVGGAPDGAAGSDVLLTETATGDYDVKLLSDAGRELAAKFFGLQESPGGALRVAEVPVRFDLVKVKPWLDKNFDHPFWRDVALKCVGCGCCTFVCPTCHCFDMVDEGVRYRSERRRNWDACQLKNFTMHASGHNPRPWQEHRYRQRIEHKFAYYPSRLGRTLCTGCGRCVRACPVSLSMLEVVSDIASGKAGSSAAAKVEETKK